MIIGTHSPFTLLMPEPEFYLSITIKFVFDRSIFCFFVEIRKRPFCFCVILQKQVLLFSENFKPVFVDASQLLFKTHNLLYGGNYLVLQPTNHISISYGYHLNRKQALIKSHMSTITLFRCILPI